MHITLKQLKTFRAVASLGQVRLAAQQLNLSQPATSMAIAELENQLGCQLFDRTGNKLLINHQGELLIPLASEMLDRTSEIESLFRDLQNTESGHLRIGASTTIGNYLLPDILARVSADFPKISFNMDIRNTENIINRVTSFDLDIGCVEGPCQHEDIDVIPWKEDELLVICSPDHSLAKCGEISVGELNHQNWILRESGSGTRNIFDQQLGQKLSNLSIKMELNQTEAIKKLVQSGQGISCLSRLCVSHELELGELIPVKICGITMKRILSLLLHKKKYQSHIIQLILKALGWQKPKY
ncbi:MULTISPECIES: LysR family transcriptional regulator [unclassified Endozoicomonas]|uniref:LysR family transcriptional regulator n=1 Tax=unclassified Endozoicomonas TaxID=2644528 RepID=UPI0021480045|nr:MULTISPECIES: LysR family transcriptional regulator [unclassified Endozoicomonas]